MTSKYSRRLPASSATVSRAQARRSPRVDEAIGARVQAGPGGGAGLVDKRRRVGASIGGLREEACHRPQLPCRRAEMQPVDLGARTARIRQRRIRQRRWAATARLARTTSG
jgi:hypothetical protein